MNPSQLFENQPLCIPGPPAHATRGSTVPASRLTTEKSNRLTAATTEAEWLANIQNPHTRRAYQADITDFQRFSPRGTIRPWAFSGPRVEAHEGSPAAFRGVGERLGWIVSRHARLQAFRGCGVVAESSP